MKIWSVNYALHFGSVKIHKHCLYWSVFSADINGNIILNCLLLLKIFLLVSNYMNQVSKFYNFFLTWSETKARCIFEGFYYCHLWKVQYQLSSNFLAFFHQIFKLLKSNYSPFFLVIKLHELSFWFQRCLEA